MKVEYSIRKRLYIASFSGYAIFSILIFFMSRNISVEIGGIGVEYEVLRRFFFYEIIFTIVFFTPFIMILKTIYKPFEEMLVTIKEIKSGKYQKKILPSNYIEINEFGESINSLSEIIQLRERELILSNKNLEERIADRTFELQEVIEQLKNTQSELIVKEKLASIGKLAGGIAHEVNNPLGAILASIQLMKMDIEDKKYDELVENIGTVELAVKKVKEIMYNLGNYAIKGENINELIDVSHLMFRVLSVCERRIKEESKIKMEIDIEENIKIKGSIVDLTQVLINMVENAREAVVKKNIADGIIILRTYSKIGKVFIELEDNGIGIKEENLMKIFEPFYTTKDVGKGMGLGLAIGYNILRKNNADVKAYSVYGKGTKFVIEFEKM